MKETKGERTRRYLYTCAIALFREKGYEQVSVDEIVKQAGVAKGTFYIYFKTKADIIMEMLNQYDDYYDSIMSSLSEEIQTEQRLREIVRASCCFTRDVIGLDLIRVLYTKYLCDEDRHAGVLNEDRNLYRILTGLIGKGQQEGVYRTDICAEDAAIQILRMIRSVFFEWCGCGGELDLEGECLRFLEVLCRAYHI